MVIGALTREGSGTACSTRALLLNHGVIVGVTVALVGLYPLVIGVRGLGLFVLGLGGFLLLLVAVYVTLLGRRSGNTPATERATRNLDLVASSNLTMACGILSLAGGAFFLANGQTPPYYGDLSGLEIQWSGLVMGLVLGPMALLASVFQHLEKHFTFSLLCTIAVTFSIFYIIGYLGGLLGISAVFFVIISKDEFLS